MDMKGIWNQMQKTYGEKTALFGADEDFVAKADVISTGSHILNNALGVNGFPQGRVIQLCGRESSGKTMMSLIAISNWQKQDPKNWALFIDCEATFSPEWAAKLGVDLSRLKVHKSNSGKEVFEMLCGVPHKELGKKKAKDGLLDVIFENGGAEQTGLGVIVLDSVAAMQPPILETSGVADHQIAPMGRFLSSNLPRLVSLLAKTNIAFIGINQLRIALGTYGNPESSPGGSALKHASSLIINLKQSGKSEDKILNESGDMIGHYVNFKIDKNKVASPFKKGKFAIEYLKGIVREGEEIVDVAISHNIISRPNNVMYEYGEEKWKGRDNVNQAVEENEELKRELLNKIYAQIGVVEEEDASTMSE